MLGAGFAIDRENKPKPGRHFFLHQRNDDPSIQYRGDFCCLVPDPYVDRTSVGCQFMFTKN